MLTRPTPTPISPPPPNPHHLESCPPSSAFQDSDFPHDHRSLGDYKFIYNGNPVVGQGLDEIIKWWVQVQVQVWYHVY